MDSPRSVLDFPSLPPSPDSTPPPSPRCKKCDNHLEHTGQCFDCEITKLKS